MRVAVVGAGVFGAWSAKCLADRGHEVLLVDAYGPANGRASSADFTRIIRAGYGADAIYSQWAQAAWADWQQLATDTDHSLVERTGAVFLGEPGSAYVRATASTLADLGIAAEVLSPASLARRFPQIALDGLGEALFEPGAGVIRARQAVRALVDVSTTSSGATYQCARVAIVDEQSTELCVRIEHGRLDADAFVFACGPWLAQMFPQAIGARIRPSRQEVLYFGTPPGSHVFSTASLPVWIDFGAGLYGIPDFDGLGFKVGVDRHGPIVDPDTVDRVLGPEILRSARAGLARRFPPLHDAPLLDARVCQYENTATGDFIIDRHPQWPHCWIVGGGSGHGFKHGPSVGRHVAALVAGEVQPIDRFRLAGKTLMAQRTVH